MRLASSRYVCYVRVVAPFSRNFCLGISVPRQYGERVSLARAFPKSNHFQRELGHTGAISNHWPTREAPSPGSAGKTGSLDTFSLLYHAVSFSSLLRLRTGL
jgi:hypothetical protein